MGHTPTRSCFDYLFVEEPGPAASHDLTYILVIKDSFSHFCYLIPCAEANAFHASTAILQWFSTYGECSTFISDRGLHFKNQLFEELSRRLGTNHYFTAAYSPWANGSVERLNRDILSVLRTILN